MSNALVLGAGPVAALTCRLLKESGFSATVLARPDSVQAHRMASETGTDIVVPASRPDLLGLAGKIQARVVFSPESLPESYSFVFIAVPFPVAAEILQSVLQAQKISDKATVVLLSSGLGVAAELTSLVDTHPDRHLYVVSFSHFFAAAKRQKESFILRALKKRIHLGGPAAARAALQPYLGALRNHGVSISEHDQALQAESRNLNLYVHSALGLTKYSLEATFSRISHPRYLYKLYPEGPLSPRTAWSYAGLVRDLATLFTTLGLPEWNFLEFLQAEGYPVPEVYLRAIDVARFPRYGRRRQSELLYARYTGLLVDPYSLPDKEGRYFDFSAVAISPIRNGVLPRMPGEELYNLWVAQGLAQTLGVRVPSLRRLLRNFQDVADTADAASRLVAVKAWKRARRRGLRIGRNLALSVPPRAEVRE